MKILITGAGGAAAISVWKSLGQDHQIFMADMDPCAAGLYLVPANQRRIIPHGAAPDFVTTLLQIAIENGIELVIPTVDTELLPIAKQKSAFEAQGIQVPLSSVEALERCRDKYLLLTTCQDTGLTPRFALLTPETDLNSFGFPCFAKPRRGAGSAGILTINQPGDFEQLPSDASYLIQELLPGEEYSVDVYIHSNGQPVAAIPRLRMKIDSGIAVAAQTCIKPELAAMALTIAKKAGITYVANIQFKANAQGQFRLLEINPRFPGTLPLTAAAGVDIPQLLLKDLAGEPFKPGLMNFKELMVVRYWTEHYVAIDEWKALCQH